MKQGTTIIAVCGLKREAAMLAGRGVHVVVGGGDAQLLRVRLGAIGADRAAIVSIGICGALVMPLRVGDCVIADEIVAGADRFGVVVQEG